MHKVHATADRRIGAPAALVYRLIADAQNHHGRFLPPAFSNFRVERGGYGAGTVIAFDLKLGGVARPGRMEIAEPQPGRVMTEADPTSDLVTTWTVDAHGEACRVRIETAWTPRGGPRGLVERLFAPGMLRRLYADELRRLDAYARTQAGVGGSASS